MSAQPQKLLCPLEGYQSGPLLSLEIAMEYVSSMLSDVDRMVLTAKRNCINPGDGLSQCESAAIHLYTMEWSESYRSLSYVLNYTLRLEDRHRLKPWFSYLKLLLTALYKLPSFRGTVWRGVQDKLHDKYHPGGIYTWWAFSSTTPDASVFQSEQILGHLGTRTLFSIQCYNAKRINDHSNFPLEEEILLMPGFHFRVLSQQHCSNDCYMINIQEIEPPFPLVPPPF